MDTRIGLELRGKKKSEVTILDLSNCKTGGEIDGLTEEFSALENLDLQNASLANIKLFPKLTNLKKLDLSENRLSKGLEVLKECKNLRTLSLNNNKFKEVDAIEPLKDLEFLTHLDIIEGNEFEEDIRSKVFKLLPSLLFLDGVDKDGNEAKSEGEDGEEEELDDEEDSDEDEEDSDSDDDDGPGLSALYDNTALLDEDDEADFDAEAVGDVSSDDLGDEDEDEEEAQTSKGQKRKLEDGDSD